MYIVEEVNKYKYCERYRDPLTNKRKIVSVTLEKKLSKPSTKLKCSSYKLRLLGS